MLNVLKIVNFFFVFFESSKLFVFCDLFSWLTQLKWKTNFGTVGLAVWLAYEICKEMGLNKSMQKLGLACSTIKKNFGPMILFYLIVLSLTRGKLQFQLSTAAYSLIKWLFMCFCLIYLQVLFDKCIWHNCRKTMKKYLCRV